MFRQISNTNYYINELGIIENRKSILRYLDTHRHIRGYKFHSIAAFKNR